MAAYDINENMDCCLNCIYHFHGPHSDADFCALHGYRETGDYYCRCEDMIKRYEPEPWEGIRMTEALMDETLADDEEIMIYIVLGAAQAVKMAVIDMDDCTLKRATVIRDVARRIFTERKNENE